MSFILRDYQAELIRAARQSLGGNQCSLLVLPTGGGKTAISGYMAGSAAKRRKRVVFGVHRRELIKQTAATFDKVGIPYGIIAAGFTGDRRQPVQIASIPTLRKRLDWYGTPDLYIPDEAHHSTAATWAEVMNAYCDGGAKVVGVTATPERSDGRGLGEHFQDMVQGPTARWLIDQGYLADYEMYAPSAPDLTGVKRTAGDFNKKELAERMGSAITGNAVEHYRRLVPGRRAIVFCVSIKHSLSVVEQFQAAGIASAHIDGMSQDRDALIAAFAAGRIKVLCSVDLVSEGFDLPAIEAAIMLRPSQSTGLVIQQWGRVLRPIYADGFDLGAAEGRLAAIEAGPKPRAIILDHAGNSIPRDMGGRGHGLPDDEREWSLAGREIKRRGKSEEDDGENVQTRQCPACFRVHPPAPTCPKCGHEYPALGRTVKELEGELQKVDRAAAIRERKAEQAKAQTLEDLVRIGKARGMRNPHGWARHVMAAREAKTKKRFVRA